MNTLENNYKNFLPINRKERYYTGTVLPQIICFENFKHIHKFFELIKNFPQNISVQPDSNNNNIQFFTEYNLNESVIFLGSNFKQKVGSNETPDLVILLTEPVLYLIVVEAKTFLEPNISKFKEQIKGQKKVIEFIKVNLKLPEENIFHVGLVPKNYFPKNFMKEFLWIYWEDIIDAYEDIFDQNYFFDTLKYAIGNAKSLTKKENGLYSNSGKYMENKLTGDEIINRYNLKGEFWMGVKGGLKGKKLRTLIETEGWKTYLFEVNYSKLPKVNNWFSVKKFIEEISNTPIKKIENKHSDPHHFSHLGKDYFAKVLEILKHYGITESEIKAIFTGTDGEEYRLKFYGREIDPNWIILTTKGDQYMYGKITRNILKKGSFSTAKYKRHIWKDIKNFQW